MNNYKQAQHGTVLVTGLILITAISLVSVVTMEGAIVQDRLANNTQLKVTSFQEAEAALVYATTSSYMVEAMDTSSNTLILNYNNKITNEGKGKYKNKLKHIKNYAGKKKHKEKHSKKEKHKHKEKHAKKENEKDIDKEPGDDEKNVDNETSEDGEYFVVNSTIAYCGILPSEDTRGISLNANQAANSSKNYVRYIFDITSNVTQTGGKKTQSQHTQRNSRLMLGSAGKTCT